MTYRPDIDGLRAIAVLAVVAFHFDAALVTGGFVGVDVFFVISGYLITKVILEDLEQDTFSIARFYERRIRRILPALTAMSLLCWGIAAALLLPPDFLAFSRTQLMASLSLSNFQFWSETGYFEGASDLKPLLHTWSLAVEEQFYVVFPLLLVAARRWLPGRIRGLLWSMTLVSFGLSARYIENAPDTVFFLLPFRAWELLVGSLLAAGVPNLPQHRRLREGVAGLGLLAVFGSIAWYTHVTPFPGPSALAPVLGTAAIIWAGNGSTTLVTRILATRPMVQIGLVSYSLYLWHWPILVFSRYYSTHPLGGLHLALLGGASLAVAWGSWRWVETPFRRRAASRRSVLLLGAAATLLGVSLGAVGVLTLGWPQRLSPAAQRYGAMLDKHAYYDIYERGRCFLDYNQQAHKYNEKECFRFIGAPPDKTRVLVIGDSFAAHLVPGLRAESELEVVQYTATSCRPMLAGNRRCDAVYRRLVSTLLKRSSADVVVVAGHWRSHFERMGEQAFTNSLRRTIREVRKAKKRVVLVGQSPTFYKAIPHLFAVHDGYETQPKVVLRAESAGKLNKTLAKFARKESVTFFDPYKHACTGNQCLAAMNGEPFHWDSGHMTLSGSTFYGQSLGRLLRKQ